MTLLVNQSDMNPKWTFVSLASSLSLSPRPLNVYITHILLKWNHSTPPLFVEHYDRIKNNIEQLSQSLHMCLDRAL